VGSMGETPVGGLGTKSPETEAIYRHCLQILTAETIKILKLHTIYLLIFDQHVSRCGLSGPFGAKPF